MSRAYGANARLAAAFEATYGTPPAADFSRLPFVSCSLGSEQGLIASDLLGYQRHDWAVVFVGMWSTKLLGSQGHQSEGYRTQAVSPHCSEASPA